MIRKYELLEGGDWVVVIEAQMNTFSTVKVKLVKSAPHGFHLE